MIDIFSVGHYEKNGVRPNNARLVDAVTAAVSAMNKAHTSTDIMGLDTAPADLRAKILDTNRQVCASAKLALANKEQLGPARLVRLGLFCHEWSAFLSMLDRLALANQIAVQEVNAFHSRAQTLLRETEQSVSAPGFTGRFSWRNLFVALAVFGGFVLGWHVRKATSKTSVPSEPPTEGAV